jgi:hypothetical protein
MQILKGHAARLVSMIHLTWAGSTTLFEEEMSGTLLSNHLSSLEGLYLPILGGSPSLPTATLNSSGCKMRVSFCMQWFLRDFTGMLGGKSALNHNRLHRKMVISPKPAVQCRCQHSSGMESASFVSSNRNDKGWLASPLRICAGILFTLYQGSSLDSNAKQWRLAADFINDFGEEALRSCNTYCQS